MATLWEGLGVSTRSRTLMDGGETHVWEAALLQPCCWGALFQEAGNVITRASKALKYQVNCD